MPKQSRCFTSMPTDVKRHILIIGERIRAARLRRNWTLADFASRIGVTPLTAARLEKGDAAVGIGILFTAVWVLGLSNEFKNFLTAEHDEIGKSLEARHTRQRARKSAKEKHDLNF